MLFGQRLRRFLGRPRRLRLLAVPRPFVVFVFCHVSPHLGGHLVRQPGLVSRASTTRLRSIQNPAQPARHDGWQGKNARSGEHVGPPAPRSPTTTSQAVHAARSVRSWAGWENGTQRARTARRAFRNVRQQAPRSGSENARWSAPPPCRGCRSGRERRKRERERAENARSRRKKCGCETLNLRNFPRAGRSLFVTRRAAAASLDALETLFFKPRCCPRNRPSRRHPDASPRRRGAVRRGS